MKIKMNKALIVMLALLMNLFLCSAQEADKTINEKTEDTAEVQEEKDELEELSISADRMEMQIDDNTIELSGNVLIYDSTMNLTADKMLIYLDKDNKLDRIDAFDNVTIRKLNGSESATGERASYNGKDDKITLEGNCTLLQGKNVMSCKEIIYDRKNQKITAKGASLNIRDLKSKSSEKTDFLKPKQETAVGKDK